jgi:hypothetical protein
MVAPSAMLNFDLLDKDFNLAHGDLSSRFARTDRFLGSI